MTESPRHQNTVKKLERCGVELGAKVLKNSDARGAGGYEFPPIMTPRGERTYTADKLLEMPNGLRVVLEVDYKYKTSRIAEEHCQFRAEQLERVFGVLVIRYTPKTADGMTANFLKADIDYWAKKKALTIPEMTYRKFA